MDLMKVQVGSYLKCTTNLAGDRATDSSTVPSTSGYAVAGNVSQNSQPTTTIERHQNATEEGNISKILCSLT